VLVYLSPLPITLKMVQAFLLFVIFFISFGICDLGVKDSSVQSINTMLVI
jgi:hypothetical protein